MAIIVMLGYNKEIIMRDRNDNENKSETVIIVGRNAVLEAIRAGQELECVHIQIGDRKGHLSRILAKAKEAGIPVKDATVEKLQNLAVGQAHQGVAAVVSATPYGTMEDIKKRANGEPLFVIIADGIEDPHNLGAIIRSAEASGAHGIIVPKRHNAGLTATVAKTSAGAIFHMPVVRVSNIAATIDELKKDGMWFYCADMDGKNWCETDFSGSVGLVIGSEGSGVSRLVKEKCDFVVSLPMLGNVNSLNASVASGIFMYEIARQRLGISAK